MGAAGNNQTVLGTQFEHPHLDLSVVNLRVVIS
jgi:hypothetical protein